MVSMEHSSRQIGNHTTNVFGNAQAQQAMQPAASLKDIKAGSRVSIGKKGSVD